MPSWQSRLLQLVIRWRIKRRPQGNDAEWVKLIRKNVEIAKRRVERTTPGNVCIRQVPEPGLKGEWVWWDEQPAKYTIFYLHCPPVVKPPVGSAIMTRPERAADRVLSVALSGRVNLLAGLSGGCGPSPPANIRSPAQRTCQALAEHLCCLTSVTEWRWSQCWRGAGCPGRH